MKTDVALMTASTLLVWAGMVGYWVNRGPDAILFVLLYLSAGALHGLSMCADLLRARETDRHTALILWVTQTVTWLPWTVAYVFTTLRRVYARG